LAAFFDSIEIFIFLLREGLPLDFKSADGFSPIHYAAGGRSVETALYICEQGSPTISEVIGKVVFEFIRN
jgi:ankyrin repeat protein